MANDEMKEWILRDLESFQPQKGEPLTLNGRLMPEFADCDEQERTVTLRFPIQDWERNGFGSLHGGIIGCIADLTISIALRCYMKGGIPPTVSLTVNYMKTVSLEGDVIAHAKVTSVGRRVGTGYCEVIIPTTGKVAATAVGTFATA